MPLAGLAAVGPGRARSSGSSPSGAMLDMPVDARDASRPARSAACGADDSRPLTGRLGGGVHSAAPGDAHAARPVDPGRSAADLRGLFRDGVSRAAACSSPGCPSTAGLSLATFGSFICLFSILPLAMNQFAIDKAGFTRYMLSPLSIGELLHGKAVGNALIAAGPARVLPGRRRCCFAAAVPRSGWRCSSRDCHLRRDRPGRRRPVGGVPPHGRSEQHRPRQQRAPGAAARDAVFRCGGRSVCPAGVRRHESAWPPQLAPILCVAWCGYRDGDRSAAVHPGSTAGRQPLRGAGAVPTEADRNLRGPHHFIEKGLAPPTTTRTTPSTAAPSPADRSTAPAPP